MESTFEEILRAPNVMSAIESCLESVPESQYSQFVSYNSRRCKQKVAEINAKSPDQHPFFGDSLDRSPQLTNPFFYPSGRFEAVVVSVDFFLWSKRKRSNVRLQDRYPPFSSPRAMHLLNQSLLTPEFKEFSSFLGFAPQSKTVYLNKNHPKVSTEEREIKRLHPELEIILQGKVFLHMG